MGTTEFEWMIPFFSQKIVVKTTKIRSFTWNHIRRILNETVFLSISHKAPPGKQEERNLNGITPFSAKKMEFLLGTTKATWN